MVVHIRRKTCWGILEGCLKNITHILQKLDSSGYSLPNKCRKTKNVHPKNVHARDEVNCKYLPSLDNSIEFFYKPVTCVPPPNVTDGRIINVLVLQRRSKDPLMLGLEPAYLT